MANKRKPAPSETPSPAIEPRMLTVKGAAAYLGSTVWFVRSLHWDRKVQFLKFGNRWVVDRADLDAFIESQKLAGR